MIWKHIREQAEEWVSQESLQDYLSRLKVNVEEALGVAEPIFNFLDESLQLTHAVSVEESPLGLVRSVINREAH